MDTDMLVEVAVKPRELGDEFASRLPVQSQVPIVPGTGGYYISREYVPAIANAMQALVAEVVASLIDAGSERDAVMENDTLRSAREEELYGWAQPLEEK